MFLPAVWQCTAFPAEVDLLQFSSTTVTDPLKALVKEQVLLKVTDIVGTVPPLFRSSDVLDSRVSRALAQQVVSLICLLTSFLALSSDSLLLLS